MVVKNWLICASTLSVSKEHRRLMTRLELGLVLMTIDILLELCQWCREIGQTWFPSKIYTKTDIQGSRKQLYTLSSQEKTITVNLRARMLLAICFLLNVTHLQLFFWIMYIKRNKDNTDNQWLNLKFYLWEETKLICRENIRRVLQNK